MVIAFGLVRIVTNETPQLVALPEPPAPSDRQGAADDGATAEHEANATALFVVPR